MNSRYQVDLSAVVPLLRERVDTQGHVYAVRPELVGALMDAAIAAQKQGRPRLAGVLSNARRHVEHDELSRAGEQMLVAATMVRGGEKQAG
jgi:hypothetical protein